MLSILRPECIAPNALSCDEHCSLCPCDGDRPWQTIATLARAVRAATPRGPMRDLVGRPECVHHHGVQLRLIYPGGDPENGPAVLQCPACIRDARALYEAYREAFDAWASSRCIVCRIPVCSCSCSEHAGPERPDTSRLNVVW